MRTRGGFTLVELLITISIAAMVAGVAGRAYGRVTSQRAAANARDALVYSADRARSEAVRSGSLVYLRVQPASDRIVVETAAGVVLHQVDATAYDAVILGTDDTEVCYSARGFALTGCTEEGLVRFVVGPDTASARVSLIGQVGRE